MWGNNNTIKPLKKWRLQNFKLSTCNTCWSSAIENSCQVLCQQCIFYQYYPILLNAEKERILMVQGENKVLTW